VNFHEVLELTRRQAKLASDIRDEKRENASLRKRAAAEKDAGLREAWGTLSQLPKKLWAMRPFQKSIEDITAEQIRKQLAMEAQVMLARRPIPKPGQTPHEFQQELESFLFKPKKEQLKEISQRQIVVRTPEAIPVVKTRSIQEVDPKRGTWQEVRRETEELPQIVSRETVTPAEEIRMHEVLQPTGMEEQRDLLRALEMLSPKKPKIPLHVALGVIGAAGAGTALSMGYDKYRHRANLEAIIKDPLIPTTHKVKAQDAYRILVTYAPTIANDPIFSKDFVRGLIRHDMVDHKIVSDLIQAEKNYNESKGKKSEFLRAMAGTTMGALIGLGG